ncbi:ABC transporter ATP-binding protein [Candidatus Bipolaricaulota bacterium]|nr:ABC transporter ATP-binding protein [Candidatus Bipolaricaulota bacterium]MBS3792596.1 ABC transporter ATP-binding protein [Candidatus Bipolaricaulota bacterium]
MNVNDTGAQSRAVETTDLTKKYGTLKAVDGLNLSINNSTIYGFLGPNGAGKTTTIKLLCGLLKPTSGQARVLNRDISSNGFEELIGYMPQETALYVNLTIGQNLQLYGELYDLDRDEIAKRKEELLELIDLVDWKDTRVEELSGGMKHRASLACSLIQEPKVLFLDEPTVGVDPDLRASFWDYFLGLMDQGTTLLITTHYMDEARNCDTIGMLDKGDLIAEGSYADHLEETGTDSLEDAFLKYTKGEDT